MFLMVFGIGGGLGMKTGIYVKELDHEQFQPIAERIMQREGCGA